MSETDSEYTNEALTIVVEIVAPALGTLLAIVLFVGPLPAILAARKAADLGRLNATLFPWTLANCLGNTIYGIVKKDPYLITANSFGIIMSTFYLFTSVRFAPQASAFHRLEILTIALIGLWLGFSVVARFVPDIAIDLVGIGAMSMSLCMFAAPLSTVREVIREHNSVSINMGFLIGQVSSSFMWIIYAGFTGDMFVLIPNLFGLFLGLIQAALVVILPRKATPELDIKTEFELNGTATQSHPPSVGETIVTRQYPAYQNYETESMVSDAPAVTAITDEQAAQMPLIKSSSLSPPGLQIDPAQLQQMQHHPGQRPVHHFQHTVSAPYAGSPHTVTGVGSMRRLSMHNNSDFSAATAAAALTGRDHGYSSASARDRVYSSASAQSGASDRLNPGIHKAPLSRDDAHEPQSDHSTDDGSVPALDSPSMMPRRAPPVPNPSPSFAAQDVHVMPPLPENSQQLPPSSLAAAATSNIFVQPAAGAPYMAPQHGRSLQEQQVQDRANLLKQQELERQNLMQMQQQQLRQAPPQASQPLSSIPQVQYQFGGQAGAPPPGMPPPQQQQPGRPDIQVGTSYRPPSVPSGSSPRGDYPGSPTNTPDFTTPVLQPTPPLQPSASPSPMHQPVPVPPALGSDGFSLAPSAYGQMNRSQRAMPSRASSYDMNGPGAVLDDQQQRQRAASMAPGSNPPPRR